MKISNLPSSFVVFEIRTPNLSSNRGLVYIYIEYEITWTYLLLFIKGYSSRVYYPIEQEDGFIREGTCLL